MDGTENFITSLPEELINLLKLDINDLASLCKTSKTVRGYILNSCHIKVDHMVVYSPKYQNYLKLLPAVKTTIKYVKEIIDFGVVRELNIYRNDDKTIMANFNLSILSSLHRLELQKITLHGLPNIDDCSMFRNIHILNLTHAKITDFSALGRVHTLNLSWTMVEDVSMLGGVHDLNIAGTKVVNVSALGKVHTLDLSNTKVVDVSALGRVHTLDLSNTKVVDVSALGRVHTLDLSNTKVVDVSALGGVHTLFLYGTYVKDISALIKVHVHGNFIY
jgi:hypothetical protein